MTGDMQRTMHEAMQLMRSGDLAAATRALQRGLHGGTGEAAPAPGPRSATDEWIEGAYRVVPEGNDVGDRKAETAAPPRETPGGAPPGGFADHHFACSAGSLNYKLFVPAGLHDAKAPLLVMLHGCTQSPEDFARGTRMNALAAGPRLRRRLSGAGAEPPMRAGAGTGSARDQRRGQGEPALLAALTAYLVGRMAWTSGACTRPGCPPVGQWRPCWPPPTRRCTRRSGSTPACPSAPRTTCRRPTPR